MADFSTEPLKIILSRECIERHGGLLAVQQYFRGVEVIERKPIPIDEPRIDG